ncbi:MAG TPA: hypothetical protein VF382_08480 [Actinomycetota bacterium]
MKSRSLAVTIVAFALLAASCGRTGTGGGDSSIEHPIGTNDLVLRVDTGGGFVAPSWALKQIPQFSLYGDGRVITEGPQIEIYPGPALPNLVVQTISENGVQAILEAARAAGLMGQDAHYDFPCGVTDAPTTTFALFAAGEKHLVSAYALGMDQGSCEGSDAEARSKLAAFQAKLSDLSSWLPQGSVGEESSFDPSQLRVYVQPYTGPTDKGLRQRPIDWPLSQPLASFGRSESTFAAMRCGVVGGTDLSLLLPKAERANELTPWRSGGKRYSLVFRPLLPDEHTC